MLPGSTKRVLSKGASLTAPSKGIGCFQNGLKLSLPTKWKHEMRPSEVSFGLSLAQLFTLPAALGSPPVAPCGRGSFWGLHCRCPWCTGTWLRCQGRVRTLPAVPAALGSQGLPSCCPGCTRDCRSCAPHCSSTRSLCYPLHPSRSPCWPGQPGAAQLLPLVHQGL